jgi:hypothetical protein
VAYFESQGIAPVYFAFTKTTNSFMERDGGATLVQALQTAVTASHDYFLIELIREPIGGSLSLISYGFGGAGTEAAAWYFVHQMLPVKASITAQWIVGEWQDSNGNHVPDAADTFTVIATGP